MNAFMGKSSKNDSPMPCSITGGYNYIVLFWLTKMKQLGGGLKKELVYHHFLQSNCGSPGMIGYPNIFRTSHIKTENHLKWRFSWGIGDITIIWSTFEKTACCVKIRLKNWSKLALLSGNPRAGLNGPRFWNCGELVEEKHHNMLRRVGQNGP